MSNSNNIVLPRWPNQDKVLLPQFSHLYSAPGLFHSQRRKTQCTLYVVLVFKGCYLQVNAQSPKWILPLSFLASLSTTESFSYVLGFIPPSEPLYEV